ncbi:MAG: ATP-binding protein [Thermodesulfobacteriota bacterium]|nr:ATP-binding protein [Thermodesulfobacteriota bacterium]
MRIKIGVKLTVGFMLVLLLIAAFSLYSLSVSQKSLQDSVGKNSIFLAEEMLKRMDHSVYLKIEDLQKKSKHPLMQKTLSESNKKFEKQDSIEDYINHKDRKWVSLPKEEITPFMQALFNNEISKSLRKEFIEFYKKKYGYKVFGEIFVTNKYGVNIGQTGRTSDYRQDDEQWWQIAREKGFYVSGVEYDESTAIYAINIGIRVVDDEASFIGVMKAVIDIKGIVREAKIITKRYETTRINLLTEEARLIYGTIAFKFMEDVSDSDFFKKIKRESGFFIAKAGGRERLYSYARSKGYREFEGLKLILVVGHDVREVLKSAFVLRNNMIVASLILISIGIIIAFLMSRSITNPLTNLKKITEDISKEKLDIEIDPQLRESKDEIGDLAVSFSRMAKNLKEVQEELIRKERLAILGQLAGGVGHELRNPLGVIKNAAYFLNRFIKRPDPKVKETLDILDKAVGTSERIISSLLDFASPKPPIRQKTDINGNIQEAMSHITVPENVHLESQLEETLPTVQGDPDQLRQVFGNIILNAIQAMSEGGRLVVMTSASSVGPFEVPSQEWVIVSISDTGAGIPEEILGKVFEPLFTTKAKGIGLGLALTRTIVEAHGGTITVESEEGKGSTFTVRLPVGLKGTTWYKRENRHPDH